MNFAMEVMQIEIVHYEERYVNGTEATAPECLYVVLYGKRWFLGRKAISRKPYNFFMEIPEFQLANLYAGMEKGKIDLKIVSHL